MANSILRLHCQLCAVFPLDDYLYHCGLSYTEKLQRRNWSHKESRNSSANLTTDVSLWRVIAIVEIARVLFDPFVVTLSDLDQFV